MRLGDRTAHTTVALPFFLSRNTSRDELVAGGSTAGFDFSAPGSSAAGSGLVLPEFAAACRTMLPLVKFTTRALGLQP